MVGQVRHKKSFDIHLCILFFFAHEHLLAFLKTKIFDGFFAELDLEQFVFVLGE
jgi:hypothetical protein